MIAVFVNPHSRANRRKPRFAAKLQEILGDSGRVFAPRSLEELTSAVVEVRRQSPSALAVHGGDGTLHKTLSALIPVWGEQPLPPLALLAGGTMNVVSASLGLAERPETMLKTVVDAVRAGRPFETVPRRCMRIVDGVGQYYGFIVGNGLLANFLKEYYATGRYGPARAIWLIFRCFLSAVVLGPFSRRLFRRFEGEIQVDGNPLPWSTFASVGGATVREVGLGFKLYDRADDDLDRLGVLAIHAGPLALLPDMRAVHAGRGIAPSRALSTTASTMSITPKDSQMFYTVDGDLYKTSGALSLSMGPLIRFIKPQRALIAQRRGDTMSQHP